MKYDSVMVGIYEKQESKFSLYPNPAVDIVTIETLTPLKKGQLSISNLHGLELITCQITSSKTQLDISGLPGGIYFVRLKNDKAVAVGKFIKQ